MESTFKPYKWELLVFSAINGDLICVQGFTRLTVDDSESLTRAIACAKLLVASTSNIICVIALHDAIPSDHHMTRFYTMMYDFESADDYHNGDYDASELSVISGSADYDDEFTYDDSPLIPVNYKIARKPNYFVSACDIRQHPTKTRYSELWDEYMPALLAPMRAQSYDEITQMVRIVFPAQATRRAMGRVITSVKRVLPNRYNLRTESYRGVIGAMLDQ